MKFYLACVASFALMLIVLHSCVGEEYMSVAQASSYHHGKGGEAKRKRLHRHTHYGWYGHGRVRWIALSAAVPLPHDSDTAETTERNGNRFDTVFQELGRTPQQIINEAFVNIGWKQ